MISSFLDVIQSCSDVDISGTGNFFYHLIIIIIIKKKSRLFQIWANQLIKSQVVYFLILLLKIVLISGTAQIHKIG